MKFIKFGKIIYAAATFIILVTATCWVFPKETGIKNNCASYNVIIISLGNVGTQHMSLYGYGQKTTPMIDKWVEDAFVFDNFYSPASWTLPVATSFFTSLQPYSHKIFHRAHNNILDGDIITLPEIMKSAGYKTASFTGGVDYSQTLGHMRGFEDYAENPFFTSLSVSINQAKEWLDKNAKNKFFLFVHGYDAHSPFTPPDGFKGIFSSKNNKNITVDTSLSLRGYENTSDGSITGYYYLNFDSRKIFLTKDDIEYMKELYDEEVLYEDYLVGNFLNNLDKELLRNTVIIILAEHGEMFAKHGRFGRAGGIRGTLYDEVVHIPLIVKMPYKKSGRIAGFIQAIDLMPTILEIINIKRPDSLQGKSFLPLLKSKNKNINKCVFGGTWYWTHPHYPYISINEYIRNNKWKLISEKRKKKDMLKSFDSNYSEAEKWKEYRETKWPEESRENTENFTEDQYELYNTEKDPDELNNIINDNADISKKLIKVLDGWSKKTKNYNADNISKKTFSQEKLENIKRHGYW